jgi:phenylpropionate dioxygenase-like ring-hydroxylating dioxygenase large terminal subunit
MDTAVRKFVNAYDPQTCLSEGSTPPFAWYTDQGLLDLEHRTVFSRAWHFVGRAEQMREPGQYITAEVAGEAILIVRGNDSVLRGFFNVCRHHAAAVMTSPEGKTENLRCPYHGWTYDLEGRLIVTPEFAGVANFDRGANGLVPVQTSEWQGWVFVKLDGGGLTLEEYLGADLIERVQPLNVERLNWFQRRSYFLNCNWKVFVDNYLDGGYHVPHIHRGLNSVLDYSSYTIETGQRFCLQSSPIVSNAGEAKTTEVRKGKRAFYYWIYPNLMINMYEGVMDTNLVIPRGVDKTEVVFDYYFADVSSQARERNLASIAVSEQIQCEDVAICESVQRGLNSRSYSTGRLSVRREAGEHLFHRLLHADLHAAIESDTDTTIGQ